MSDAFIEGNLQSLRTGFSQGKATSTVHHQNNNNDKLIGLF
jgi:hypothetical protein